MENKIFNSFFIKMFVSKMFYKVSNKNFGRKTSNTLFSLKMENNIFNSLYTKVLVSPCIYKLIIYIHIYIYIYIVILRQPFIKTIGPAWDSDPRHMCAPA